jgi:hypothetical protein
MENRSTRKPSSGRVSPAIAVAGLAAISIFCTVVPTTSAADVVTRMTTAAVEKAVGTSDVLAASAQVEVPRTAGGAVTIHDPAGAATVGVGVPRTTSRTGAVSATGTVVYADPASPADTAVQRTAQGARVLVAIKNASAPKEYRFSLTLPQGARAERLAETGEVIVTAQDGTVIGGFDAPWAKDANGAPVDTSYRIEGSELVQTVNFTAQTAFPVVADPSFWQITKCVGFIGGFIAGNALLLTKVAKLGSVFKAARLIAGAGTREEKWKMVGAVFGEITGIASVVGACS